MGGNLRYPTSISSPSDSSHHGDNVQYSSFVCPNCKEKKWRKEVLSRNCSRKIFSTFFVVVVPTFFWVLLSVHWFAVCKQTFEELEKSKKIFQDRTIEAGKLILGLNMERELTATFLTARSEETRKEAKYDLDMTRSKTDAILNSFYAWPGTLFEQRQQEQDQLFRSLNSSYSSSSSSSQSSSSSSSSSTTSTTSHSIFRSRHLFMAYLNGHRSQIHTWSYFVDEIQFYTDLIDTILVWIVRGNSPVSLSFPPSFSSLFSSLLSLPNDFNELQESAEYARLLLQSHSYLMSSLNYLGAEQALCSVYHSVVCLSRRETLYYANFSFAAEAFFRFYRQSLPSSPYSFMTSQHADDGQNPSHDPSSSSSSSSSSTSQWRWSGPGIPREWRVADHRLFFPNLYVCRRELVSELDYAIMTGGLNDGEFHPPPSTEVIKNKLDELSAGGKSSSKSVSKSSEQSNSPCSYNRKNETKLYDTDLVTEHELDRVLSSLKMVVESVDDKVRRSKNLVTIFLVLMCLFLACTHLVRGIYSTINASKKRKRASKARSVLLRREQQAEGSSGTGSAPLLLVMKNKEFPSKQDGVSNHHQNYPRQSSATNFDDEFNTTTANNLGHHRPSSYHQTTQELFRKSDQPKQVRIMEAKEATISRNQPHNKMLPFHQLPSNALKPPSSHHQQQQQQQQQHQQQQHSLLQVLRETEHFNRQLSQQQQQAEQNFIPLLSGVISPQQNNPAQNPPPATDNLTSTSLSNFVAGYKIATV